MIEDTRERTHTQRRNVASEVDTANAHVGGADAVRAMQDERTVRGVEATELAQRRALFNDALQLRQRQLGGHMLNACVRRPGNVASPVAGSRTSSAKQAMLT